MDEDLFYFLMTGHRAQLHTSPFTFSLPFCLLPYSAPHLLFILFFVSSPKFSPNSSQLPLTIPPTPFLFVSLIYSLTFLSCPYYLPLPCVFIFFIFSFFHYLVLVSVIIRYLFSPTFFSLLPPTYLLTLFVCLFGWVVFGWCDLALTLTLAGFSPV